MAKDKPEHGPSEQEVFERVVHAVQAFVVKNALHILLAIAVIVLVVVAYKTFALKRQTVTLTQWEAIGAFPEMTSMLYGPDQSRELREQAIRQCRTILREGGKTPATPWVALKLANLYATGGEWQEAAETYERVVQDYPESAAAEAAREGLGAVLEEMGHYSRAAEVYEELARDKAPHHLLGAARAREFSGDGGAAEAHYRAVLERTGDELYLRLARARLNALVSGQLLEPPPPIQPMQPPEASPSISVSAETPTAEAAAPAPSEPERSDR